MKFAGLFLVLLVVGTILPGSATSADRDTAREKLRLFQQEIATELSAHHDHQRKLPYYSDACEADFDSSEAFVRMGEPGYFFSPSFWVRCAKSLKVDADKMIQHIESLAAITKDYHCFHDIAKDPLNSDPLEFQPELGQRIFSGSNEGVVDFAKEMELLKHQILYDGYASMYTFWQINMPTTAYRDGHVGPALPKNLFNVYTFYALPDRFLDAHTKVKLLDISAQYYFDENAKIQLTIVYLLQEVGSHETYTETKYVKWINDYTVHDFTIKMADHPSAPLSYQTLGGRTSSYMRRGGIFQDGMQFFGVPPTDFVPDSFYVYDYDGHYEKYRTILDPVYDFKFSFEHHSKHPYHKLDRADAEAAINTVGAQYDAYQRSIAELPDDFGEPARKLLLEQDKKRKPATEFQPRYPGNFIKRPPAKVLQQQHQLQKKHGLRRKLEDEGNDDEEPPPTFSAWGPVNDDTMFFKLPSFAAGPDPEDYLNEWKGLLEAANQLGATKLIIDYSLNGGGFVTVLYAAMMALFPEVGLAPFTDNWDINYNDAMKEWLDTGIPLVELIDAEYDTLESSDIQARIDTLTTDDIQNYAIAISGMLELCFDEFSFFAELDNEAYCEPYVDLAILWNTFVETPTVELYSAFIKKLPELVLDTNPWSVNLKGDEPDLVEKLRQAEPEVRTRGGVESKTTIKYDLLGSLNSLIYDLVQEVTEGAGGNPFEQYVILSAGDSGSAACIAPLVSSQIAKNAELTGATRSVKLVAWGGTGNIDDHTSGLFPASVQDVRISQPIIGEALLQLLVDALPEAMSSLDHIVAETKEYSKTVAIPPYFAEGLPRVPTRTFYDVSMEPGAAPLQYVKIPLDGYIPQYYYGVSFEDSSDLDELYTKSLAFFD